MLMPYIIDGYNLLWAINKTEDTDQAMSDIGLCKTIGRYFSSIGDKGQIVFDGIGPPEKTAFAHMRNLEVIFTGPSIDADTIIENKIAADSAPKRLTIVSSDLRIVKAAKSRKCSAIKSLSFWKELQKQLKRTKRANEPAGKRQGLSQSETDQWLKLFDLDE